MTFTTLTATLPSLAFQYPNARNFGLTYSVPFLERTHDKGFNIP
jgi:hypothetical protein